MYSYWQKILTFIAFANAASSSLSKPSDDDFDCTIDMLAGLCDTISVRCGLFFFDFFDTFDLFAINLISSKPSSGVVRFKCFGFMLSPSTEETVDSSIRVKITRDLFNLPDIV